MRHTLLSMGTVTELVDEIMQKDHGMEPCYLRCKTQADPSTELFTCTDSWYLNFHQKADRFLKNKKKEMHTPFAGIILFRFKGTFSAHLTTVKAKKPSHC